MRLVALLVALAASTVSCLDAPNIWPVPAKYSYGTDSITLSNHFKFTTPKPFADLDNVFHRYRRIIFPHHIGAHTHSHTVTGLSSISVTVANPTAPLQLETDESYKLNVNANEAQITCVTLAGANRAMETFAQLVKFNFTAGTYTIGQVPWSIEDAPRFHHRGILLDTSRHFQPVPNLQLFIDALAANKLNVFHWHLSDSQSFPFESLTYPKLWNAAYDDASRYSQEDVKDIVEYARERGVRVMIEVDVPGHAQAMCTGYPEVCPSPSCLTPIDPSVNATYELLTSLFNEMTGGKPSQGLFPENLFHLGGDEVDTSCWSNTPRIAAWLKSQNFTTDDAYMHIVEQAHSIIQSQGRDAVNWDEVWQHFGTKLDKRSIIHVWRDKVYASQAANAGYRVIVSNDDVWYLDNLSTSWQQMYENEPTENIVDPTAISMVMGGETCMWGETVDASDLFNTVYPRASAAAERLWSPYDAIADTDAALPRLEYFRCYMDQRGFEAAPVLNSQARTAPGGPGACRTQ